MDRLRSECNCGSSSDTSLHRRSDCVTTEKLCDYALSRSTIPFGSVPFSTPSPNDGDGLMMSVE